MIACRACESTHNRDVRERGMCGCSCHHVLRRSRPEPVALPTDRKPDQLDMACLMAVSRIRARYNQRVGYFQRWEPRPMPDGWTPPPREEPQP